MTKKAKRTQFSTLILLVLTDRVVYWLIQRRRCNSPLKLRFVNGLSFLRPIVHVWIGNTHTETKGKYSFTVVKTKQQRLGLYIYRIIMTIQCHYDVLGVPRDADQAMIKKHHRKMALKYHPDKNLGDESAAEKFRLVQQAYECLSDTQERKWYDDHRDAILAGWTANNNNNDDDIGAGMLFNVIPFMHPGCYSGYHNENGGFFKVYGTVFQNIVDCERRQTEVLIELPTEFGFSDSEWSLVSDFYQIWESFASCLNFAWEDKYNTREDAPNRRVRRLMEDENTKARRKAKRVYNQDILSLVSFIKRRDPRVRARQEYLETQKLEQEQRQKQLMVERQKEKLKAKEVWKEEAARAMMEAEEEDRLAGRVRLADLEDDYDYGGKGKKKKKKKKNKGKKNFVEDEFQQEQEELPPTVESNQDQTSNVEETSALVNGENTEITNKDIDENYDERSDGNQLTEDGQYSDEDYFSETSSEEEEEEPDIWRCECCRKEFKSEGQLENHLKSKKHKEAFKKYQKKLKKKEEEIMAEMMDDLAMDS